jgi:aminomethyltransferase
VGILKTSLHEDHLQLHAKMAPFAGFDMPLQYSSVKEEVLAVRNSVGLFDVSHMGEFFVDGVDAISFVDFIITNDFKNAELKKAVYSPLCRDNGTVIDDLIAYKLSDTKVLICVNASNIEKDWNWISSKVSNFNCTLVNKSNEYSLLALQGPKSESIIKKLSIIDNSDFPYYSIIDSKYQGHELMIARTGYTGEDGFEIFGNHQIIKSLWKSFLAEGVVPCGLASRDVLRLEVCYPLYGHELNDEITPFDASLAWTVKLNKESFIGRSSLIEYKPKYQLIKLSLERGIPREGYTIHNAKNEVIGRVTSGTMSVIAGKGIAFCLVEKSQIPSDKKYFINIRNTLYEANLHSKPFVTGGHK